MTIAHLSEVASLIDEFNDGPLRVNRPGSKQRNKYGGFDDVPANTFVLNPVHVYPVTGDELEQVPEADRHKGVIALVSRQELIAAKVNEQADRVEYGLDCASWRVFHVEERLGHGLAFISMAVREERPFPSEFDS